MPKVARTTDKHPTRRLRARDGLLIRQIAPHAPLDEQPRSNNLLYILIKWTPPPLPLPWGAAGGEADKRIDDGE